MSSKEFKGAIKNFVSRNVRLSEMKVTTIVIKLTIWERLKLLFGGTQVYLCLRHLKK